LLILLELLTEQKIVHEIFEKKFSNTWKKLYSKQDNMNYFSDIILIKNILLDSNELVVFFDIPIWAYV
jgi:hypothetical protein